MADYSVSLSIEYDKAELDKVEQKIDNLTDKSHQVDIRLDQSITKQLQKLETYLENTEDAILNVKKTLGTLDNGKGMDNILVSINKMSKSLTEISGQFKKLDVLLDSFSKKDFSGLSNVGNNVAKQVQQAGKIMSEAAEKATEKISSKEIKIPFKVTEDDSKNFEKEMDELVRQWTNGKGKKIGKTNITTVTTYDEKKQARVEELIKAQVTYNDELGQTIKKTIALAQIGHEEKEYETVGKDGKKNVVKYNDAIMGWTEVSTKYTKSLDNASTATSRFVKQQKKESANLTNTINQLHRSAIDQNASRPIKENGHLDSLSSKYNEITDAINRMQAASDENTFIEEQNNVKALISKYKSLKSEYKNAENVSSKLKGTDFDSALKIAESDLRKLKAEAREFPQALNGLDDAFNNITDKSSLDDFTNQLKVAKAELSNLKAEASANQRSEKVGIGKSVLENSINDLKRVSPEIDKFKTKINGAEVTLSSLSNELSQVKTEGDLSVVTAKFNAFTGAAKSAGLEVSKTASNVNLLNNIISKIEFGDDNNSKFDIEVGDAEYKFGRLADQSDDLRVKIELLKSSLSDMKTAYSANDYNALIDANERYEKVLKDVNNQLEINAKAEKNKAASNKQKDDIAVFQAKIDAWLKKNSAAAKEFGSRMLELRYAAEECDKVTLDHLKREFQKVDKEAEAAGKKTLSFLDNLKSQVTKYFSYLSVAEVFMYTEQALRSMFEQVKLIDSAMTELKKVTDETEASYEKFLTNAASRAREIGTTIDGLVTSTSAFARLGYGFEDAQGLAEVANIYAVVGDEIESVESATESLISTMAAFKDEMNGMSNSDFAMSIVDKFNEIGNNFAISSGGIGEALERSASSLMAANNTIDESIALITAANTVVQDPETVGTAFKTISMRIRGAKTELEEAGLETEGMVESTAKLRDEVLALTGVDIMKNNNEFKGTYEILDELSKKWKDLSDIQQATVTELIAGKRQGNIISSLMENFDTAREALEVSLNSSGSAMQEHEKWQQSLEAQILRLKASWQSLSQSFLSSDFLKVALDGVIALVDGITSLIDTIGTLPTLIGLFAGGLSAFKNDGIFKFDKDAKAIKLLGNNLLDLKDGYKKVQSTIGMYNSLSSKSQSYQDKFNKTIVNSSTNMGRYLSGLKGAEASFGGYIGSLITATFKTAALEIATVALNAAITMGVSFAISAFIKLVDEWIVTADELAEKVDEITSKFKEQHTELVKNKSSFESQAKRYGELSKGVDSLGRNISLTTDEYAEYQDIVNSIADQVPSLINGYDAQGNAILNYKGNVEELTDAYEDLIRKQNDSILKGDNYKNIEEDFKNVMKDAKSNKDGIFKNKISLNEINALESLLSSDNIDSIIPNIYGKYGANFNSIIKELENAGVEKMKVGESGQDFIKRAITQNKNIVQRVVNDFNANLDAETEGMRSAAQAVLSEAFDFRDSDYKDINDKTQSLIRRIVGNFDAEQFDKILESGKTVEEYINGMLDSFKGMSNKDAEELEATFDLQTKFNNNEISYGEYVKGLQEAGDLIEKLGLDEDVDSQIKLNLGLNEEGFVTEYENLLDRLSNKEVENNLGLEIDEAKEFLNDLSSQEFSAFKSIIPEFEPVSEYELEKQLYKYTKGGSVNLKLRPEVDTSVLKDAGWEDVGEGAATVFTSTFSNAAGNVAMNFTPIIADKNGNYQGVLSPEELQEYAEGVIDGTREDNLNLQIGAKFEGKSAIAEAESAANYIHKLQDYYYNGVSAQLDEAIERAMAVNGLLNNLDLEVETTGIEALNTALAESKSATGLTAESISALKERYKDLDGYNVATLFEETANGIRLNSTELSKLETQYKNLNKQDLDNTLSKLTEEYNELTVEIDNCGDASKRAELYAQRDGIRNQINDVATLASQYEGLTSAYNEWLSAQEAGQDRDEYESILSGREDIEKEMASGWLDDAAVEYLELLSGKELSTEPIKEQIAAYKELDKKIGESGYSIWDFFTKDEDGNATSDGVFNFFDTVKSLAGETHAWIDENGDYHFDFQGFKYNDKTGDAAIAEILGTSEELVHVLLKASEDAGFVVNIDGDYTELADLKTEAEQANDRMKELSATTYTFNFDSTDFDNLNEQISEAKSMLGNLENEDGTLKVGVSEEDYRKAQDMIAALIYQKQSLDDSAILHVDTSQASTEIETAIGKLQEFRQYTNTLELETAIGADTSEATTNIQSVLTYIEGLNPDIKAGLGLDTTEVQTAIDSVQANIKAGVSIKQEDIDTVNAAISSISNGAMVDLGLNTELIDNYKSTEQEAKGTVNWDNNIEKVTAWINQTHEASGTVNWGNDTNGVQKTFFGQGYINWTVSEANGTANVNGTAFKQGSWGTKDSGTALMGELGRETIVRDGRFFTVGDNGAGFYKYQKGDIIFNHKQTEELFKNGIVTSGGGRGKAFAGGSGDDYGSGGSGIGRGFIASQVTVETKETKVETERDTSGSSGDGGNRNTIKDSVGETGNKKPTETSTSTKKEEKEFKETIDWIEIAIDRIERAIDQLDTKANSVYRTWSERNSALADEITKVKDEIDLQEKAYTRYIEEASKVGLSSSWAEKVRNGEVDISTITDEDLADKISEYQDWYEKALDCKDAILDLTEKESELYAQRFDNISTRYEGMLGVIEHEKNMLEEDINKAEVQGYLISSKYYDALIKNENRNIIELEKQKAEMLAELNTAIEGTEEWYRRVNEIDAITESIEEGRTSIAEYEQTIQQLSWETFDLLQDKISSVTEEADFLIELLSSEKLFNDKGRATDEGKATFGLHGQNYNTYMYQADLVAEEAERLKKQLESEPYDTELEERYREMISLQQEYILNAQKEKEAIRDLVAEGIEIELDALQELIDKKNEELQSERDLYEYQKKVKEQTKEIASLEKQLAAFSGDDSEEAQQKIQQIKVDLESAREELQETEYDKFISDSESLLDNLYLEYETLLNERLDNLDALVSDVINEINSDAAIISDTLSMKAEEVGYSLSDSMRTIWDDNTVKTNDVLTNYGKEFIDKQTTTNDALKTISSKISSMITHLDNEADEDVEEDRTSSAAEPKSSAPSSTAKPTTAPPSNKGSSGDGTPKKGDKVKFIDGQYYYDSEGKNPSGSKYKGKEVYITNVNTRSWATHPYHISTGNKLGKGDLGWVKKNQISGYATGKRNFINDEIAWTQEKGREFIVRPSDGAILTPVAKGDSVLNASASNNIWNMANSPADFIRDNLGLGNADVPSGANVNNNVTQNFENVVFSMPNVHSYNELISQMQKDKNFEKLILSMSIDRLAGKSSLAKNKAIR